MSSSTSSADARPTTATTTAPASLAERRGGAAAAVVLPDSTMPAAEIRALCSPCAHTAPGELMEPFAYLCRLPGKDVRSRLIDAFDHWLRLPAAQLGQVKQVITMLHNASLLVDDIEDRSQMRRGEPVAHAIFGEPLTINCANYVYFLALELVHNTGSASSVKVFVDELLRLHRGQGWDIYWRDNYRCPTLDEYKQMVMDKTGGLLRLAVKLMQCFSANADDLLPLTDQLGLYYQIRDDYINLTSEKYMENKAFCEDLTEGKMSYPIIYAILAEPDDHRLQNILKQRTNDVQIKKHAVEFIRSTGALEHTAQVLAELEDQIRSQIKELGGNAKLEFIIDYLSNISF